ncbi:MAG: glycosyltransferase family 2 protein [Culicoidibacterales bacterium]
MKQIEQPQVSVIVHLQMIGKSAEACLQALSNQTLENCQFIIIHDGKSGDALYFANEFARYDLRFTIHLQVGLGCGVAYNYGLTQVVAPYVVFLNGFDVIASDFCEQLRKEMQEEAIELISSEYTQPIWQNSDNLWIKAGSQLFNKMYRMSFLRSGNYQFNDQNRYADWLFNYQTLAGTKKLSYTARTSVTQNLSSVTKDMSIDHCYDIFAVLEEISEFVQQEQEAAIFALYVDAILVETLPNFWQMNDSINLKYQTNFCLNFLTKYYQNWRELLVTLPKTDELKQIYGRTTQKNIMQLGTWRWRITWVHFLLTQKRQQFRAR